MKLKAFLLASSALMMGSNAYAQLVSVEVNDGTTGTCYNATGSAPCSFFSEPTVDTFVGDISGNISEITTNTKGTTISTQDGSGNKTTDVQKVTQSFNSVTLLSHLISNPLKAHLR